MGILKWLFKPKKATIDKNAHRMRKKYPLNKDGYFGNKGKSNQPKIRQIDCDDQYVVAKDFFESISFGGEVEPLDDIYVSRKVLDNITSVILRERTSTPDSPAVDINVGNKASKVKSQKIHFERRKNNEK